MEIKSKTLFVLFLLVLVLTPIYIGAQQESLGIFKNGEEIELIQICSNDTSLCDLCNISSVKYPNSSKLLSDVSMTKRVADFNYSIRPDQANINGDYLVNGFCKSGNAYSVWNYEFTINNSGDELSTSQGIMYIILLVLSAVFFFILISGASIIDAGNPRNEIGQIIGTTGYKYMKMSMYLFAYVLVIFMSFMIYSLSWAYLPTKFISNIFRVVFNLMIYTLFPVIVIFALVMAKRLYEDSQIKNALERNLPIR